MWNEPYIEQRIWSQAMILAVMDHSLLDLNTLRWRFQKEQIRKKNLIGRVVKSNMINQDFSLPTIE